MSEERREKKSAGSCSRCLGVSRYESGIYHGNQSSCASVEVSTGDTSSRAVGIQICQ